MKFAVLDGWKALVELGGNKRGRRSTHSAPRALLLGDREMAAPLHAVGVPVTLVHHRQAPARFSRYVSDWLEDPRPDETALVERLLQQSSKSSGSAVVYYQQDDDLLFVSRHRETLAEKLRFVVPDARLVGRLLDKWAFQELATELQLPVPPARVVRTAASARDVMDLGFPVLVKPLNRGKAWDEVTPSKALLVYDQAELGVLLTTLSRSHPQVLLQRPVPGAESRIESYHAYVDADGAVAGEFTGRKIRTYPTSLGHSTALETTHAEDVAHLGRAVLRTLRFRGVAKLDFKRDLDGRLWLLEINPRFNLWHRLGAAAGVNLPAIVWADLMGLPRPPRASARPGATWCRVDRDWRAVRREGARPLSWLPWVTRVDVRAGLELGDPMPLILGKLVEPGRSRMLRLVGRGLR